MQIPSVMTDQQKVVHSIRSAYRQAPSYDLRKGDERVSTRLLSEDEIVAALTRDGIIDAGNVFYENKTRIDGVFRVDRPFPYIAMRQLERMGVAYVTEFEGWRFSDLLKLEGVGIVTARKIERSLATLGIFLIDSAPDMADGAQIAREEDACAAPAEAAKALMSISARLSTESTTVAKLALGLADPTTRKIARVRVYLKNQDYFATGVVRRVVSRLVPDTNDGPFAEGNVTRLPLAKGATS